MSFGLSVSDFITCSQLAHKIYHEFKDAPGECKAFAKELLSFPQILLKVEEATKTSSDHVRDETLQAYAEECKELLYVQILGLVKTPHETGQTPVDLDGLWARNSKFDRRMSQLKYAAKIPKL